MRHNTKRFNKTNRLWNVLRPRKPVSILERHYLTLPEDAPEEKEPVPYRLVSDNLHSFCLCSADAQTIPEG